MAFGIGNLFRASFSQGAQASSAQASAATPATATSTKAVDASPSTTSAGAKSGPVGARSGLSSGAAGMGANAAPVGRLADVSSQSNPVDRALAGIMDLDHIDEFAKQVQGDEKQRFRVAQRFANIAAHPKDIDWTAFVYGSRIGRLSGVKPDPQRQKDFAARCAAAAVTALGKVSTQERVAFLGSLTADEARAVGYAIGKEESLRSLPSVTEVLARKLVAEYHGVSVPTYEQAAAIEAEVAHIDFMLAEAPGLYEVLCGPVPEPSRKQALAALIKHRDITPESFKDLKSPWTNPVLDQHIVADNYLAAMAPKPAQTFSDDLDLCDFIARQMDVQPNIETNIKNFIAAAAKLPPEKFEAGINALAAGTDLKNLSPDVRDVLITVLYPQSVRDIAAELHKLGGPNPEATSRKVVLFTELGPSTVPLFFTHQPDNPIWALVDNSANKARRHETTVEGVGAAALKGGRIPEVHEAFDNFLAETKLPGGPIYHTIDRGQPDRVSDKIRCAPRYESKVGEVLDDAALVGLLVAGVIGVVATAGGSLALAGSVLEIASTGVMAARSLQALNELHEDGNLVSMAGLNAALGVAAPGSALAARVSRAIAIDLIKTGIATETAATIAQTMTRTLQFTAKATGAAALLLQVTAIAQDPTQPQNIKSAATLAALLVTGHLRQRREGQAKLAAQPQPRDTKAPDAPVGSKKPAPTSSGRPAATLPPGSMPWWAFKKPPIDASIPGTGPGDAPANSGNPPSPTITANAPGNPAPSSNTPKRPTGHAPGNDKPPAVEAAGEKKGGKKPPKTGEPSGRVGGRPAGEPIFDKLAAETSTDLERLAELIDEKNPTSEQNREIIALLRRIGKAIFVLEASAEKGRLSQSVMDSLSKQWKELVEKLAPWDSANPPPDLKTADLEVKLEKLKQQGNLLQDEVRKIDDELKKINGRRGLTPQERKALKESLKEQKQKLLDKLDDIQVQKMDTGYLLEEALDRENHSALPVAPPVSTGSPTETSKPLERKLVFRFANNLEQITDSRSDAPGLLTPDNHIIFREGLIEKLNQFAGNNPNIRVEQVLKFVAEVGAEHPEIGLTHEKVALISKLIKENQPRTEGKQDGVGQPLTVSLPDGTRKPLEIQDGTLLPLKGDDGLIKALTPTTS